jgi:hypothetical protein
VLHAGGTTTGTFTFGKINMGVFNSSSFDGTDLEVFAWGVDGRNDLGIDFAFTGTVSTSVPGTVILVLLGLAGIVRQSQKRKIASFFSTTR